MGKRTTDDARSGSNPTSQVGIFPSKAGQQMPKKGTRQKSTKDTPTVLTQTSTIAGNDEHSENSATSSLRDVSPSSRDRVQVGAADIRVGAIFSTSGEQVPRKGLRSSKASDVINYNRASSMGAPQVGAISSTGGTQVPRKGLRASQSSDANGFNDDSENTTSSRLRDNSSSSRDRAQIRAIPSTTGEHVPTNKGLQSNRASDGINYKTEPENSSYSGDRAQVGAVPSTTGEQVPSKGLQSNRTSDGMSYKTEPAISASMVTPQVGAIPSTGGVQVPRKGLRRNQSVDTESSYDMDTSFANSIARPSPQVGAVASTTEEQVPRKGLRSKRSCYDEESGFNITTSPRPSQVGAIPSNMGEQVPRKGLRRNQSVDTESNAGMDTSANSNARPSQVGAIASTTGDQVPRKGLRRNQSVDTESSYDMDASANSTARPSQLGAVPSMTGEQLPRKGLRRNQTRSRTPSPMRSTGSRSPSPMRPSAVGATPTKVGEQVPRKGLRASRNEAGLSAQALALWAGSQGAESSSGVNVSLPIASATAMEATEAGVVPSMAGEQMPEEGLGSSLRNSNQTGAAARKYSSRLERKKQMEQDLPSLVLEEPSGTSTFLSGAFTSGNEQEGYLIGNPSPCPSTAASVDGRFGGIPAPPTEGDIEEDRGHLEARHDRALPSTSNRFDKSGKESKEENKKTCLTNNKTILLVVLLVAIVVVIIVAVVASGGGGGDSNGDKDVAETAQATMPPILDVDTTLIPGLPDSTWQAMVDKASPQYNAYSWIIQDPLLDEYEDWQLRQRFALATFYYAMGGPKWKASSWLDYEVNECQWLEDPSTCQEDGSITSLIITKQRGFQGSIPPELSLLTQLKALDFSINRLGGDLAELFGGDFSHPSLEKLKCSDCRLSGSFPAEALAQMPSLRSLILKENDISGELPSGIGLLSFLKHWDMEGNKLSGPIATTIGGMQQLEFLKLRNNQVSYFPSEVGKLTSLVTLDLGKNNIKQSIPSEIGSLGHLQGLELDDNDFQQEIPSEIGSVSSLLGLVLHNNDLSGTIPKEMGLLSNLQLLWMSGNQLVGSIPASMGGMTKMSDLDLSLNQLSSTIPSELAKLPSLQFLYLYSNNLSGSVPSELGGLPHLTTLDLKENENLVKDLPEALCTTPKEWKVLVTDWCEENTAVPCCG